MNMYGGFFGDSASQQSGFSTHTLFADSQPVPTDTSEPISDDGELNEPDIDVDEVSATAELPDPSPEPTPSLSSSSSSTVPPTVQPDRKPVSKKARPKREDLKQFLLSAEHIRAVRKTQCCDQGCCMNRQIMDEDKIEHAILTTFDMTQKQAGEFMFMHLVQAVRRDLDGKVMGYDFKFDQKPVCRTAFYLAHGYSSRQLYRAQQRVQAGYNTFYGTTSGVLRRDISSKQAWHTIVGWLDNQAASIGDPLPDKKETRLPYRTAWDAYKEYRVDVGGGPLSP